MATANDHSLLLVLQHEQRKRDVAVQTLREAQTREAEATTQSQALDDYRRSTAARWSQSAQGLAHAQQLHTARGFLERLDQAIAQHNDACERARAVVQERQRELLQAERRLSAIGKLIDKRRRAAHTAAARQEQKASDELAQRPRHNTVSPQDPCADPHPTWSGA